MAEQRMAKLIQDYETYHKQQLENYWAKLKS